MTRDDLAKLYAWLWPFQPDDRDYENAEEEPSNDYNEAVWQLKQGHPPLFMEMLDVARQIGVESANGLLVNTIEDMVSFPVESVSQLCQGILPYGISSGYTDIARDKDDQLVADDVEVNMLNEHRMPQLIDLWNIVMPAPATAISRAHMSRLTGLTAWLTGVPMPRDMWDDGVKLPSPPTHRQALGWLLAWAISRTGFEALDLSSNEIGENGIVYDWDAKNIADMFAMQKEIDTIVDYIEIGFDVYARHQTAINDNLRQVMKGVKPDACDWPF